MVEHNRRKVVKSIGAASLVGLAGCAGDENGTGNGDGGQSETTELVLGTVGESSSAYAMSQGIATVVNNNSDTINISAIPSEGTAANIGKMGDREIDIGLASNQVDRDVLAEEEPYNDLDYTPCNLVHWWTNALPIVTNQTDWNVHSDIEDGSPVSFGPAGASTSIELTNLVTELAGADVEVIPMGYGNLASAYSEGRIVASISVFIDGETETSYVQDMKSQVDSLKILSWNEENAQTLSERSGYVTMEMDTSQFDGFANSGNTITCTGTASHLQAPHFLDYDAVYTFLEVLYNNRESLGQYHAGLEDFANDDFWLRDMNKEVPFHPGAADFYKEIGIWNDEYTVYES